MIFQVRQGVFETNSSSTHTLTICSKDDFYVRNGDLETYSETFTSPSGDEMVAFGAFGYDG